MAKSALKPGVDGEGEGKCGKRERVIEQEREREKWS